MLDTWDVPLRINMYGCASFPGGYPIASGNKRLECTNEKPGMGWLAAAYFCFVVIFGGLIMPTMLVGIVAVSFEESFRKCEDEKKNKDEAQIVINLVQDDMPEFFYQSAHRAASSTFQDDGCRRQWVPGPQ